MVAEEDNFDIDIYGDGGEDYQQDQPDSHDVKVENTIELPLETDVMASHTSEPSDQATGLPLNASDGQPDIKVENGEPQDKAQKIASTDDSAQNPVHLPKQAPQTQGLKRQDGADDRFVEPGATPALFISELHWWVTDDDIRGWANQSECEDELVDMTFSEHKVNGKSKGQAYVLFKSPQAATAAKQKIESFGEGQQYTKKFTVSYTNPFTNPFRTLPKDGPMRSSNNDRTSGFRGGYRGNRGGGYNNRGGGMGGTTGYNRGGFQQPMTGGFQSTPMNAFQGLGGAQPYGGFQNRGGMMGGMRGGSVGMRGARGGMGANAMMAMPMGGMGMGNMGNQMGGLGMGMPQMGVGTGMQGMQSFQPPPFATGPGQYAYPVPTSNPPSYSLSYLPGGSSTAAVPLDVQQNSILTPVTSISGQAGFPGNQAHYNPAFFPQQQPGMGAADASWNPHGAKRTRQE
ncbi:RNA-dependent RNA polymerase 1 [Physcia stellaris]|nr:RNA-dependent RNA polymerase 1 [Physcia stellaris]